jgi:hypothetical protein
MRPRCQVSNLPFRDVKLRPVAILQRRTADDVNLGLELDLADPLQLLAQDIDLSRELIFVRCVLIVAAAADRKQWTGRRCSFRRGREHVH